MKSVFCLMWCLAFALVCHAKPAPVEAIVIMNDGSQMKMSILLPLKFGDLNHLKIQSRGFKAVAGGEVKKIAPESAKRIEFQFEGDSYVFLSACPTPSGKSMRFYETVVEGAVTVGMEYNLPNSDQPEFHYILIDQNKEGKTAEATFGFKPIQEIKKFIPYCEEVWIKLDQNEYGIYNLPLLGRYFNEHCSGEEGYLTD